MQEIVLKSHIRQVFLGAFVIFVVNKFYLRPWVLRNDWGQLPEIFVFSVPNFSEAIMGTIALTGILLQVRHYFKWNIHEKGLYVFSVLGAALYVISQELKFHNLGGNNVYDPYDLVASVAGLVLTFAIMNWYGFIDHSVARD